MSHQGFLKHNKKEEEEEKEEERNNAICSNIDRPRDCHTKWSKSEREWQIPYDIFYKWNLFLKNIQMNLFTKQK